MDENQTKIINSNEGWGKPGKVSQSTKWSVEDSPEPNRPRIPSSNGTEVWDPNKGQQNHPGPNSGMPSQVQRKSLKIENFSKKY